MAGMGKAAMSVVMILLLAFALIAAFSMARVDQASVALYNTTNSTISMSGTVTGGLSLLFIPMVAIIGITALFAFFVFLRRK